MLFKQTGLYARRFILLLFISTTLLLWSLSANSLIQFDNPLSENQTHHHGISANNPSTPETPSLQQQRSLFLDAELSLKLAQYSKFKQQLTQLGEYPLVPYLHYKALRSRLSQLTTRDLDDFFSRYLGQVIAKRLRRDLIRYYARRGQWKKLLSIYQPQSSAALQCHYLQALIKTDQSQTALKHIKKLWLKGHSQAKSCDPVFAAWEKAGLKTQSLIWQRIELAMKAGNLRLARHLGRSLPKQDQYWIRLWQRAYRQPQKIAHAKHFKHTHPYAHTIAIHAVQRLARRDALDAIKLLEQLQSKLLFNTEQQHQLNRIIGLAMARQHLAGAHHWLQKIPLAFADTHVLQWRIRSNIRKANWRSLLQNIEALPAKQQASLRWQFWWAYANAQIGRSIEATSTYRYLASRRSYYGFLAADQLQLPYAFENRPIEIEAQEIHQLSEHKAARRAYEFFKLGRILSARREWYDMIQQLDEQQKITAAKLAQQWHWHDRAIYTLGQTAYRDDIALRFPLPLRHSVHNWSQKRRLDPAWTYAIIRRESAFMSDARSPAGALGLMQLMPSTARRVAQSMRIRYHGKQSLLKSEINIELGTAYLEQMLQRNDQQAVLATAAYNAGPLRVKNWLPDQPMEAVRWIETIPYTETRNYVSNVLAYMVIYQHRMGKPHTRLSQHMPHIPSKNTVLQADASASKLSNQRS